MTAVSTWLGEGEELASSLRDIRKGIGEGRFPARVFNDQQIYELEQERLFARAWCFLAHESEVPSPGDYVTRYIGNNNIIVARDEHGQVHAHLNMCRHRGNMMCKSEMGNASHFRCSYHGWTYKNSGELVGVPYMKEGYEGRLKRKDWGLVKVRVDTYEGLVFGCLDPGAPELDEYLGGFQFYLDFYLKQGGAGSEVHGPPDHWVADTDWKICAENFAGDGYHTPVAHQFGFNLGYFPSSGATHSQGWAASIPGRGHGIGLGHSPNFPPFGGFPDELADDMRRSFSPDQVEVFSKVEDSGRHRLPEPVLPDAAVQPGPGRAGCALRDDAPLSPDRPWPHGDVLLVPGSEERLPGVQGGGVPRLHPGVRAGGDVRAGRLRELDEGHPLGEVDDGQEHRLPVHHGDGQRARPLLPRPRSRRHPVRERHQLPQSVDPVGRLPGR